MLPESHSPILHNFNTLNMKTIMVVLLLTAVLVLYLFARDIAKQRS